MYRSRVKNEARRLKNEYFNRQLQLLNDTNLSCKKFWNIAKELYGNKLKPSIPTLIDNGNHYITDNEKATLLNNYFAKQSTLPNPASDFTLPPFKYLTHSRLD